MAEQIRTTKDGNQIRYETNEKGELVKAVYVDHYGKIKPITDANMLNSLSLASTTSRIAQHVQHDAEGQLHYVNDLKEKTRLPDDSPAIAPFRQSYESLQRTADEFKNQSEAAYSRLEYAIDKAALDPRSEGHGLGKANQQQAAPSGGVRRL